jgi:non-ribosomal peptide synthetase-like protein
MSAGTQAFSGVHRLFEGHAAARSSAPAIVYGDRVVSYGELDGRANQLARYLRRLGVRKGDRVGLVADRSAESIMAILAVLKSGAAYIPLDPNHPLDRLRHIVAEAGIQSFVSEAEFSATARALGGIVIEVDDVRTPWCEERATPLSDDETGASPTDLSYVLYTSGSTGRPKGVMAEHRNVTSFVEAFNRIVRLTPEDRVFQGFSLGFDGSVEEMWMAFSNGGALVVPPRGAPRFGDELAALLTRERVTVFSTVPTSLSTFSASLPTVRLLVVSGERCSQELVNRYADGGRRMLNVYGPTETTVNATAAECSPDLEVTIGRPLAGYELRVLDDEGREVVGPQIGELFIGGPGVARGYLNQPELTKTHFIDRPSTDGGPPRREYRTGDRVRWREDGELVFVGRADGQVKIRGFRIELSEIEAVLVEHRCIRSAVVSVVERNGHAELAAHVVAQDGDAGIDRAEVSALLCSRLPSYMIPAFLDVLVSLPTLASGKVDRKALPPPADPLVRSARPLRGPRDEVEASVLQVMRGLFKNDTISIDDDFFVTLGGYSLLAARLVSQLRQELGFEVAIRDVYEHPTIEALSAQLKSARARRSARPRSSSSRTRRVSSRDVFHGQSPATRAACMAAQMVSLYAICGVTVLPYIACFLPFAAWRHGQMSCAAAAGAFLIAVAGVWPLVLLLSIAVKWIVVGRYSPGAYPLWGWYYFRCWLVRHFELIAMPGLLAGTPLLSIYYRWMGARVGKNCTLDTAHCAAFDLLSIGDHTSIGAETRLLGYRVEDGLFLVGSVDIGSRCFVGIHSVVGLDVRMADEACLDDLSLLPDGASIGRGESASGSPARAAVVRLPEPAAKRSSKGRRAVFGLLHVVTLYALLFAIAASLLPSAFLLWAVEKSHGTLAMALAIPAAGVVGIVAFCLWIPLLKCLILRRVKPGVYPVESFLYLRKWAVDFLMQASRALAKPLYTTIYFPAWLRLLGAKIGRRAEISTVSQISPELTEIGEQSFFADGSMIGGRRVYRGRIELARSRIGRRSFVGNSAILPVGKSLGDGCLLGCLSAPPAAHGQTPDGTDWLGSPSFALPHREKVGGFDERVTHEPTPALIAARLAVDTLRIALPSAIAAGQYEAFSEMIAYGYEKLSFRAWLLAVPGAVMACGVLGLLCVVATKQILMGTFRPTIKPLWSLYVWLNEAVNGTYETIAAPLLSPLLGTPYCAPWLRLMGCKIGRHVYLETTLFSEFDLVQIGDYAALNADAIIQNHLFEDRIMKSSTLKVGDDCTVGAMAVVLYDSEMQAGSSIGPLSLLMKGETLPSHSRWMGIPTAEVVGAPARRSEKPRLVDREPALVEG